MDYPRKIERIEITGLSSLGFEKAKEPIVGNPQAHVLKGTILTLVLKSVIIARKEGEYISYADGYLTYAKYLNFRTL